MMYEKSLDATTIVRVSTIIEILDTIIARTLLYLKSSFSLICVFKHSFKSSIKVRMLLQSSGVLSCRNVFTFLLALWLNLKLTHFTLSISSIRIWSRVTNIPECLVSAPIAIMLLTKLTFEIDNEMFVGFMSTLAIIIICLRWSRSDKLRTSAFATHSERQGVRDALVEKLATQLRGARIWEQLCFTSPTVQISLPDDSNDNEIEFSPAYAEITPKYYESKSQPIFKLEPQHKTEPQHKLEVRCLEDSMEVCCLAYRVCPKIKTDISPAEQENDKWTEVIRLME
ncbi:hypothetical protein LTR37_008946 [Vermiconidia calcicola]|uniref:Uncharacterized protein n=1 Tax=Vermiconidia calcicola TaxID=1690605 RepID=A0ACC3N931_9PEZI|nr:hypothetical protein LTR37_008946 [Vermiconidia calcicola]